MLLYMCLILIPPFFSRSLSQWPVRFHLCMGFDMVCFEMGAAGFWPCLQLCVCVCVCVCARVCGVSKCNFVMMSPSLSCSVFLFRWNFWISSLWREVRRTQTAGSSLSYLVSTHTHAHTQTHTHTHTHMHTH